MATIVDAWRAMLASMGPKAQNLIKDVFGEAGVIDDVSREQAETFVSKLAKHGLDNRHGVLVAVNKLLSMMSHTQRVAAFSLLASAIRRSQRLPLAFRWGFAIIADAMPDALQRAFADTSATAEVENKTGPIIFEIVEAKEKDALKEASMTSLMSRLTMIDPAVENFFIGIHSASAEIEGALRRGYGLDRLAKRLRVGAINTVLVSDPADLNRKFAGAPDPYRFISAGPKSDLGRRMMDDPEMRRYIDKLNFAADALDGESELRSWWDTLTSLEWVSDALEWFDGEDTRDMRDRLIRTAGTVIVETVRAFVGKALAAVLVLVAALLAFGVWAVTQLGQSPDDILWAANTTWWTARVVFIGGYLLSGLGAAFFVGRGSNPIWPDTLRMPRPLPADATTEQRVVYREQRADIARRRQEHVSGALRNLVPATVIAAYGYFLHGLVSTGFLFLSSLMLHAAGVSRDCVARGDIGTSAILSDMLLMLAVSLVWLPWGVGDRATSVHARFLRVTRLAPWDDKQRKVVEEMSTFENYWFREVAATICAFTGVVGIAFVSSVFLVGPMPQSYLLFAFGGMMVVLLGLYYGKTVTELKSPYPEARRKSELKGMVTWFTVTTHRASVYGIVASVGLLIGLLVYGFFTERPLLCTAPVQVAAAKAADLEDRAEASLGVDRDSSGKLITECSAADRQAIEQYFSSKLSHGCADSPKWCRAAKERRRECIGFIDKVDADIKARLARR